MISYGSVCSGIEAATVAWHPLGWKAAWFAEIEPFPSSVLAHRYPAVPNLGDMTQIAAAVRAAAVAAPEVLVGGTPCQAFSVAGLRGGLSDQRGQLTLSFVDLGNAIDERRKQRGEQPCTIVWENVPGVLSSKDNAFGCFLAGLVGESEPLHVPGAKWPNAGHVSGPQRTVAWRVLDAQYFGVAQRRRRVFVVASARKGFDPGHVLFEFEGMRRDTAPSRRAGQGTAAGAAPGVDLRNGAVTGNVAQTLQAGGHGPAPGDTPHVLVPSALSVALRGRDGGATAELGGDVAGCLRASGGGGDKPHVLAFNSNAQTDQLKPDPHTSAPLTCSQYSAVAFDQHYAPSEQAGTLLAGGSGGRNEMNHPVVFSAMRVRRLTPRECERLQAFPDDYTLIPTMTRRKLEASMLLYLRLTRPELAMDEARRLAADGPRYKALGNSMCVNVMRWIGWRVDAEFKRGTDAANDPAARLRLAA